MTSGNSAAHDDAATFAPLTGSISEDLERPSLLQRLVSVVSVPTLLLVASSTTLARGPSPLVEGLGDTATVATTLESVPRRVSLSEARKIALGILLEAEARRERYAEEQAAVSFVWEGVE